MISAAQITKLLDEVTAQGVALKDLQGNHITREAKIARNEAIANYYVKGGTLTRTSVAVMFGLYGI